MSEIDKLKESDSGGDLWGFWTHTGKAIVHLASKGKEKPLFCEEQWLEKVGEYNKTPSHVKRPKDITPTFTYAFVVQRKGEERPQFFSVNVDGRIQPEADVCILPKLSPYRYLYEPKSHTDANGDVVQEYETTDSAANGLYAEHWSSEPKHSKFLQGLLEQLKGEGLTVKVQLLSEFNYLAVSVSDEEAKRNGAVGFPVTFPEDRTVSVKIGNEPPENIRNLSRKAKKAKDALLPYFKPAESERQSNPNKKGEDAQDESKRNEPRQELAQPRDLTDGESTHRGDNLLSPEDVVEGDKKSHLPEGAEPDDKQEESRQANKVPSDGDLEKNETSSESKAKDGALEKKETSSEPKAKDGALEKNETSSESKAKDGALEKKETSSESKAKDASGAPKKKGTSESKAKDASGAPKNKGTSESKAKGGGKKKQNKGGTNT